MTEQEYNGKIRAMAKATRQKLLFEMSRLNLKETGVLMQSLKSRTRKKQGLIHKVSFDFAKQGIYAKLGVGRGLKYKDRSKGNGKRQQKDWYTKIIDKSKVQIGDFATQYKADEAVTVIADAISTVKK